MEHSLFPTETKLKFYIERLIYGVVIAMPLQPMVGDVLLWLAIGIAFIDLVRRRNLSLPTGWLSWTVMFFVLWTGVSAALSDNAQWALTSWFYQIIAGGGIYYLVRTYISTPKQWRYFLQCVLGTAILVCFIGVYEYIFVPNQHINEWVDATQFPKLMRRMSSTLMNPNLLGAYLLMILSVSISYLLVYWKGLTNKILSRAYKKQIYMMIPVALILFVTLLLTYSRGIWISFGAMVIYWGIFVERRLLLSLLAVPIILYFYDGEIATRLWSIFQGHDTSADLRWALWDSTMYIVRENPIWGIGWNTFYLVYPDYNYYIQGPNVLMYHAHNLYLNMLAEIGIPGLISFITVLLGHVITSIRLQGDVFRKAASISVGALAVGVLVSGLSDFELYSHQVTITFWLLMGWVGAFVKAQQKTTIINHN